MWDGMERNKSDSKSEDYIMIVRAYRKDDLKEMIQIWNEVVEEGVAFPQEELLDEITGAEFFASQT